MERLGLAGLAIALPALGALGVLAMDLLGRGPDAPRRATRAHVLAGIRMSIVAASALLGAWLAMRAAFKTAAPPEALFHVDGLARFGIGFMLVASVLVLALSLTHFGLQRSRPAEPVALLLFSMSGMAAALASQHLLVWLLALELAWLPVVALSAGGTRRLTASEASLKAFFAHALSSLLFALGAALVFGATGAFEIEPALAARASDPVFWQLGLALVFTGLVARAALAPFHPWSPDLHDGAPAFVTAHLATALHATSWLLLLRIVHAVALADASTGLDDGERLARLLGALGGLSLIWGYAMALIQVSLRRLVGWMGVGQAGYYALALIDTSGPGAQALLMALLATGLATIGFLAILSSLGHHERACESIGDLSGMMFRSPIRTGLMAIFLLSLGGFPGTIGFTARLEVLALLERGGHRGLLLVGLLGSVFALTAMGRPLLAMLRPVETMRKPSRALTNEQVVLVFCGALVLYFGFAPAAVGGTWASDLARLLASVSAELVR